MRVCSAKIAVSFGALVSVEAMLTAGCTSEVVRTADRTDDPTLQAELVFEEAYSNTGRLQVYRDRAGHLSASVVGVIGKDDADVVRQHLDPSVVQIHRNLLPGVAVPPILFDVDRELVPTRKESATPVLPQNSEDLGAFIGTACQQFLVNSGAGVMYPVECTYSMNSVWAQSTGNLCPACGDWSFFWNESPGRAAHVLNSPFNCPWSPIFYRDAWTWGYSVWWTGYCSAKVHVINHSDGLPYNFGVTRHRYANNPPD